MGTHLITGGAGFVAANLAKRILQLGDRVILVDDLSAGHDANVAWIGQWDGNLQFLRADCADPVALLAAVKSLGRSPIDDVWHLAANSDILAGSSDLRLDVHRTFMTTTGVLLLLREIGPARIHFASSSAIYGDRADAETDEATGPVEPISYYGAMKLASEAQIRAAVENFVPHANIYRLANIVGTPATHGVLLDFLNRLTAVPDRLVVRGNGTQRKPYLHVSELVDAVLFVANRARGRFNVFNIGPEDDGISVARIAEIVVEAISPRAIVAFGTEPRGWVGDVPRFRLSIDKLARLGWRARLTSEEAVRRAVTEILAERHKV